MFRRKEENGTDTSIDTAQTSMAISSPSANHSASESSQPAAATSSASNFAPAATVNSPFAPAAAAQPQPAARPASPAPSFRTAPATDFTRAAAAARSAESARQTPAASTNSSAFATLSDKASLKTNRRVLTVGNDILLKGEIATCDRLVIEGRVEAKLSEVHTVEIAECGSFKGTAEVEDAEISGVFEGDLIVRNRLVIYSSGEVRGNITYGEIEIERGGKLTGQIKTVAVGNANLQVSTRPGMTAQEVKARAAAKEFAA